MVHGVWDQLQASEVFHLGIHLKQNTPRGFHGDKGRRNGNRLAKSHFCWSKPAIGTLARTGLSWIFPLFICSFDSTLFCFMYFFQGPLWWLLNPLFHINIPVASYWHWLITLQVERNTWRVFKTAQLKREAFSYWVSALPWALQEMKMPITCSTRRKRAAPYRHIFLLK